LTGADQQDCEAVLRELLEFDPTRFPSMEAKAIEIANRIAGPRGGPPSIPDPVQVLEDAAALMEAGVGDLGKMLRPEGTKQ